MAGDVSAVDIFYGPARWAEKVRRLTDLIERHPSDDARRYLGRARSIHRLTWERGDVEILEPGGAWGPFGDPTLQPYGVFIREQSAAIRILEESGAMDEIVVAVIDHCEHFRPEPPYKPELLKGRLEEQGWLREPRVPPPDPEHDALPINDRYDALKFFQCEGREVGVAVEIEPWQINNDLIKFWRGYTRGQIAVGVLVQPDPATVHYCFGQMRLMTEPLFRHIPIAFLAPDGPGLEQSINAKKLTYRPFPMPQS